MKNTAKELELITLFAKAEVAEANFIKAASELHDGTGTENMTLTGMAAGFAIHALGHALLAKHYAEMVK